MPELDPQRHAQEQVEVLTEELVHSGWSVLLFNDEVHTFDEVIIQLIKATGCSRGQAEDMTWKVHLEGRARVFTGEFEECLRVEAILSMIGLITKILG